MHELSLVMEVVRRVDAIAKSNNVSEVDTIVLQIGEIATVVPHFVQACYPAAIDGTWMADTKSSRTGYSHTRVSRTSQTGIWTVKTKSGVDVLPALLPLC